MIAPLLLLLFLTISVTGLQINTKQAFQGSDINVSFIYLSEAVQETGTSQDEIIYYSLSLGDTVFDINQALAISVISTQRTFLSIYMNIVPDMTPISKSILPGRNNYKIQCSDYNVITCPIFDVQSNQTVIIALYVRDPVEYILLADQIHIQQLEIDELAHTIQLSNRFVDIYTLDMTQLQTQNLEEVTIKAEYLPQDYASDYKVFTMRAGPIPEHSLNSFRQKLTSYSLGSFSQQLTLFNTSQQYFVIITGQAGLSLTISASQPSSQIQLSTPVEYLYDSSIEYEVTQLTEFTYNPEKDQNITQYGVYIQKIRGSGTIVVSACSFSYNVTEQLGFSDYIVIHQDIFNCDTPVISVRLADISWQLGVRFIVEPYQQQQDDKTLYYFQQRVQSLNKITTQCVTYSVESFPINTEQQHIILRSFTTIPKQNFVLKSCKLDAKQSLECNPITIGDDKIYMISNISEVEQIQVCLKQLTTKVSNLYYGIVVGIYPEVKSIGLDREVLGFVNSDELVLYQINGVQKKANTTLEVRVKLINGEIAFHQNCTDTVNLNFCHDNVDYDAWHYSASYNLSEFQDSHMGDIKFGVTGTAESIFSVIAYLDDHYPDPDPAPEPTPTPTPLEMEYLVDGINNITISDQPQLLFYSAHIVPYNITILSLDNVCMEQFTNISTIDEIPLCSDSSFFFKSGRFLLNSFYLRVSTNSDTQNSTTLTVNISVPIITMTDIKFVMLSCAKYCYSVVKITYFDWNKDSIVALRGPGYMNYSNSTNLTTLKFQSIPFAFTAILPNGGDLYIQILDGTPNVLTPTKQSFTLDYFTPLTFVVPVTDTDFSTILINSFGRKFSAIWKLYTFNISQQNAIMYGYPDRSETPLYKSPAYASSSTPVTLQNSEDNKIPLECDSYEKSYACFYTVFLKNAEQSLDFLNDNGDIEISLNNQINFMQLNLPMIHTSTFSVNLYDVILLKVSSDINGPDSVTNSLKVNQDLISIQPRSSCGTLEVGFVSSQLIFGQLNDKSNILEVYSTQPCSYSIAITSCALPLTFTSTPIKFSLDKNNEYYTIYTPSSQADSFNIQLWMNISAYNDGQNYSGLIMSVYQVIDHQDCISAHNILVSTSVLTVGSVPIYFPSADQFSIKISLASQESNLYLIHISASKPTQWAPPLTLLITQEESLTLLPPNSQPQPVFPSLQPITYIYESTDNMWEFCYLSIIGSDSQNTVGLNIADALGSVLNRNIKMEDKQSCVMVSKRDKDNISKYTITLTMSKVLKVDVLYIYSKQYVQSVQTNHPHTALFQPASLLRSLPNSKYGHCYNYDITNIQTAINIIFYPAIPFSASANSSIYIPGNKLKSLYDIKQISSSRTGQVIDYEVKVHLDQLEEDNIQVCFNYDGSFYTRIIDEFDNYKVMLNEQSQFKNISSQPNMTALQIFKFVDLNMSTVIPPPKEWLVTEVIRCDNNLNGNMTLLGSSSLNDIVMGNIAQFQQVFSKYNVMAGLAELAGKDHYYVGIKYTGGENVAYSINTFKITDKNLPQSRWSIGDSKINAFLSEDKRHLIVQLPLAVTNQTLNQSSTNYTIYVINRQNSTAYNSTAAYFRCPANHQISTRMLASKVTLYNQSLVNPNIAMFKISVNMLPGRTLAVLAKVVINETNGSMPITYFYNAQQIDIENDNQEGDPGSGGPHLGLILLMLAIATLLVVLFRIIYRLVRRRMNANTVQFELSEQTNQPAPTLPPAQAQRQSVRDNTGYGEFVEEEVSV